MVSWSFCHETRPADQGTRKVARPKKAQPTHLEHRASGQARVWIAGIDHYLGTCDSPESWIRYYELMASHAAVAAPVAKATPKGYRSSINELILAFTDHDRVYYGPESGELSPISRAVRPVDIIYGTTPADEFGPLKLQRSIYHPGQVRCGGRETCAWSPAPAL